jgi:ferrous iron transport protein B
MLKTAGGHREICLVGNPNSGKTTLFNSLTGASQRVGNWPGVTVEVVEGTFHEGTYRTTVVDLPGIYSLKVSSEDERVARDYLLSRRESLVINILDATNLERNLYLTAQLLELGVPMVVVLTMADLARRNGIAIDEKHLSHHLGAPVFLIDATSDADIRRVRNAIAGSRDISPSRSAQIGYPEPLEEVITRWEEPLEVLAGEASVSPRWLAVKILEGDCSLAERIDANGLLSLETIDRTVRELSEQLGEDLDIVIADSRFGFVHGVTRDVVKRRINPETVTERVDRIVLHPVMGIPVFFFVMYSVFWVTIALGGAAIDFFDIIAGAFFVEGTRAVLLSVNSPAWLVLVLADGIGVGLQTVATFVPIIFAMFFMLSVLENSGYMARAAFVMDRVMRWIGLPGKSFVPLMVGFGCTVPAIISTRTLESRKDRLMTVFIAPLMSCGARLPVYALFAAAFFPNAAGPVVFSLYLAGIVMAVLTGILLKHTLFPGEASHLVMELPPYHRPKIRNTLIYTWTRMRGFVRNAGATIAVAVAILGVLNAVPWPGRSDDSILARTGKIATPVFASIGIQEDNWPATVGLFTGLFAKEAIVGTLNSLYSQGDAGTAEGLDRESAGEFSTRPVTEWIGTLPGEAQSAGASLVSGLREPGFGLSGDHGGTMGDIHRLRTFFDPISAYAYLLFVLLYLPCLAAFGAALKELGPRYGWLLGYYLIAIAWAIATLFYQLAAGGSVPYILAATAVLAGTVLLFHYVGNRSHRGNRAWS